MRDPKARCPKCGRRVDRVDGEYARHAEKGGLFCTMSKREIIKTRNTDRT